MAVADDEAREQRTADVLQGDVAREIVSAAETRDARLIVTGMDDHGALTRLIGMDTPLAIVNEAAVPVRAVPAALTRLPRRVVIAVNDGTTVRQAGALGAALMRDALGFTSWT